MLALPVVLALAGCPVDPAVGKVDPALERVEPSERKAFILRNIEDSGRKVGRWTLGWGVSYTLLSAGQFAFAGIAPKERRPIWIVGGISAFIGALSRVALLPRVVKERRRIRKHGLPEGECESLAEAERSLARAARGERLGTHVVMHLVTLAFSVSMGAVLGAGFKHPIPGIRLATLGGTLGQIMLLTRPRGMIQALETYRGGRVLQMRSAPLVLHGGGGLSLTAAF